MQTAEIVPIASRDFWVKVIEMLQQNWALIDATTEGVTVYFLDDDGRVFDELKFGSDAEAQSALILNGFCLFTSNPDNKRYLTLPPAPFRSGRHPNGPIYSSGRYWQQPLPLPSKTARQLGIQKVDAIVNNGNEAAPERSEKEQPMAAIENVSSAFELLIEQLTAATEESNRVGSDALLRGDHAAALARIELAKQSEAAIKTLSEMQEALLSKFASHSGMLDEPSPPINTSASADDGEFVMKLKGAVANGTITRRRVTVLASSTICAEEFPSLPEAYRALRKKLLAEGDLERLSGSLLKLRKAIPFNSPSGAAQFVAGCSVSGNRDWHRKSDGKPLGAVLKEQK